MRCRCCKRAIVYSRRAEDMVHAAGCANGAAVKPWAIFEHREAELNERLQERTQDFMAALVKMETFWRERLREARELQAEMMGARFDRTGA